MTQYRMTQYRLIKETKPITETDKRCHEALYSGEDGRIFVERFCRLNPGWTWREVGAPMSKEPKIVTLGINDSVHKSKADT